MNAVTFLARPLPQAQPPQAGGVPASRSQAPSGKDEDRPAFTPSDTASVPETQAPANKPSASDVAETTAAEPAEAVATGTGDAAAATEPPVASGTNGNALLIAQAVAAAPPTPVAVSAVTTAPVAASAVAAQPGAATTIAAAGKQIRQGASPPPSPTPVASPSSATAQTDSEVQEPSAQPAGPAPRPVAPNVSPDAAKPPQGPIDSSNANKPNALNTLLDASRPQNAPSATGQPAAPTATPSTAPIATQPMAPISSPSAAPSPTQSATPQATRSAQTGAVPADALAPIFGGTDSDAPSPARTTADAPTAPSISFGTDLGSAAHAKTATAAYEAVRAAAPIIPASEQVAMQIHRAIEDGIDKLTVELKPASLGRVQAEIQFQNDHRVHVVLSADRPATLDALRSDARALERALQDAGLRADAGSLSFRFENGGGQPGFTRDGASDDLLAPAARGARDTAPLALAAYATVARPGGIDIRV
jgi:hypothetical protein